MNAKDIRYYEYKYRIPHEVLPYVRAVLDALYGGTDPFPEGDVDSIYYDTLDALFLRECTSGEAVKHKLRIRGYGDGTFAQAHLKEKHLSQVKKLKGRITPVGILGANAPEWSALDSLEAAPGGPLATILATALRFGPLVPAVRVRYHRLRYRQFDLRITLDTNVEISTFANGLTYRRSHLFLPDHVLEIKTVDPRPHLPLLGLLKLPPSSYSKYKLGCQLLDAA
jgi:hypothetical protein